MPCLSSAFSKHVQVRTNPNLTPTSGNSNLNIICIHHAYILLYAQLIKLKLRADELSLSLSALLLAASCASAVIDAAGVDVSNNVSGRCRPPLPLPLPLPAVSNACRLCLLCPNVCG